MSRKSLRHSMAVRKAGAAQQEPRAKTAYILFLTSSLESRMYRYLRVFRQKFGVIVENKNSDILMTVPEVQRL